MRPGDTAKVDYEYVREGMCNAFLFVEPLGGWRKVVDHPRFADAERITLGCDNLSTHVMGSLYTTFPAEEAYRLMTKLVLVHSQARQLVERGGTGAERDDASMFQ